MKGVFALQDNTLLLIDGHAMAYRSFYALPELSGPDGTPTNAILGFFNMILKIMDDWNPSEVIVVFDAKAPTFRHKSYEDYKKGRKPTPEEFKVQLPILQDMLRSFGTRVEIKEGVEADDVIASIALESSEKGRHVVALSSDKDLMQILRPGIKLVRPLVGISKFKVYDDESFLQEFGFAPSNMADYLALLGDKIDNIPGVPGIGKKTAADLISKYGTLEEIMANLNDLKASVKRKMEESFDQALESRKLIYLKTDVPLEDLLRDDLNINAEIFSGFCRKLGLKNILERVVERFGICGSMQRVQSTEISYKPSELKQVSLEELLTDDELACRFTVEGNYPLGLRVCTFSLMAKDGRYWQQSDNNLQLPELLLKWFGKNKIVTENYKELYALLTDCAPDPERVFDIKTAHYLLHPDASVHDLESVNGRKPNSDAEALEDIWKAKGMLSAAVDEKHLGKVLDNIDLPLIPVLFSMERYGIKLDQEHLWELRKDLNSRIEEIEREITETAQTSINLNSPKQVAWLLFEHLGLPSGKKTKTGYSTNIKVLEGLASLPEPMCEVPKFLLEYREISKMCSGFVDPLLNAVIKETGCVHGTFETTTTGTGRLSSRDPNLQNLPVYGYWSDRLRGGLIPHSEDRGFVAADYSQIELRVLAHMCGDERLLEIFRGDRDIHTETAALLFNVEPSFITPELRRIAKMVNFGILYGMSSFGLAQRMGMSRTEASEIIHRYFEALPGVSTFIEETYENAKKDGYTKTLFGRIRPLNEVTTVNGRGAGAIKRVAVNSPIQGTAADIAKIAMINFFNEVVRNDHEVNLVLQVHDSLVCECPLERRKEIEFQLVSIMEKAVSLAVPLKVEAKYGTSIADI